MTVDTEVIELSPSCVGLTLIDFGFACIGSPEAQISSLSLGSVVYSTRDPCPKDGRDLFLFLSLLYMEIHLRMDPILHALFEQWLNYSPGFCSELRRSGSRAENTKWIYGFASQETVRSFPCCPLQVVRDLLPIYSALQEQDTVIMNEITANTVTRYAVDSNTVTANEMTANEMTVNTVVYDAVEEDAVEEDGIQ